MTTLNNWIKTFIKSIETERYNYENSSYGLKHIAESMLGHYVSNVEMKQAMKECGFYGKPPKQYNHYTQDELIQAKTINLYYPISKNGYRLLEKISQKMRQQSLEIIGWD